MSSNVKLAVIRHEGDEWVLYDSEGSEVLGRHDTKEEAEEQERAIQASKHAAYRLGVKLALADTGVSGSVAEDFAEKLKDQTTTKKVLSKVKFRPPAYDEDRGKFVDSDFSDSAGYDNMDVSGLAPWSA